ncbi:MAG: glycosyltransferase, partial [Desulfofundulus sp.]
YPGNSRSLADMIVWLLQDRQLAQNLRQRAFRKVQEKFNWRDIALSTRQLYHQVWDEYRHVPWYSPYTRSNRLFNRMSKIFARA